MTDIWGIDPGGITTGIVEIHYDDDTFPVVTESWGIDGSIPAFAELWSGAESEGLLPNFVICEQFVGRNVHGADLSPLRLQGAVEALCLKSFVHVVLQPASGKDSAVSDAAMKRGGFEKSMFEGDHHQDRWEALRHLLVYLKRRRHTPTLERMFKND